MPTRWFIMPMDESPREEASGYTETARRPKYADTEGIVGYAGIDLEHTTVSAELPAVAAQAAQVAPWYAVQFLGTTDALDTVAAHSDVLAAPAAPVLERVLAARLDRPERGEVGTAQDRVGKFAVRAAQDRVSGGGNDAAGGPP